MSIFQWCANKIKAIATPRWLKVLFDELQNLLISLLLQIGKDYIEAVKGKIIEVAVEDISNEEKFKKVFDFARNELPLVEIKDSSIRLVIEFFVNKLKTSGVIK